MGAYSYALLATNFGWSFWVCLAARGHPGCVLGRAARLFPCCACAATILAIVTLAFGEIIRLVIINWQDLTGGPTASSGIPRPSFFGIPLDNSDSGLAARLGHRILADPSHRLPVLSDPGAALLTNWVTIRLRRLPIGRAWEPCARTKSPAARSASTPPRRRKLTAFATGAMFGGGFAGAFFATRKGFISPESFTFQESALVLAIVVLAYRARSSRGTRRTSPWIGGFELFRSLETYRMWLFGMAMVLIMIWRPPD